MQKLKWWQKAIVVGVLIGCLPIAVNLVDGNLFVGHNLEIVLLIMFPTFAVLATLIALPIFKARERTRAR